MIACYDHIGVTKSFLTCIFKQIFEDLDQTAPLGEVKSGSALFVIQSVSSGFISRFSQTWLKLPLKRREKIGFQGW